MCASTEARRRVSSKRGHVPTERRVETLAVSRRRLRGVGVLPVPAAERFSLVGFLLPDDPSGVRIQREDHVADFVRLAGELDISSDDALDDLGFRKPLLFELRGVVVAEDPFRRSLERAWTDCRRHKQTIAPEDGRRPSPTGDLGDPCDILAFVCHGPVVGERRTVRHTGAAGTAELRPLRWSRGERGRAQQGARSERNKQGRMATWILCADGRVHRTAGQDRDVNGGMGIRPPPPTAH